MITHGKLARCMFIMGATIFMHSACFAVDGVSAEVGFGAKVGMARAGLQWDWDKQWFQSNGTYVGGYWDATLEQWQGTRYQGRSGANQNITTIGITPVFRYQNTSRKGFYAEAGVGIHLQSALYDNDGKQESTAFLFGDHLGVGYVFSNKMDLGLKLQHFSNGGIKEPNDGVNFVVLGLRYHF
ncbi:MAG TPA: acyloxyacyl hydrolase [Herminiimonas sp.]|nr:acyloxyacyl hydrolase [Herminiimonas sp.]